MSDRELLELAAKAAGYSVNWTNRNYCSDLPCREYLCFSVPTGRGKKWCPLEDDGDALRLAIKLTLEIDITRSGIAVRTPFGHKILIDANEEPDGYIATRKAIVRAAAEIGKQR